MRAWLQHQRYSLRLSSKRLRAAPLESLANLLAIGVALCLPLVLWLFVSGLQQALGNLDSETEVSVFLRQDIGSTQSQALGNKLAAIPGWRRCSSCRVIRRSRNCANNPAWPRSSPR